MYVPASLSDHLLSNDIEYIKNELTDVLRPSVYMTEITYTICQLIEENLLYVKKNGLNQKAKDSREKLLKILDLSEQFNTVAYQNNTLKLRNRNLLIDNQQLRRKLKDIEQQENLANSI